jgi:hypothetical protein
MAKRKMTDEQRQAASERMKAMHAAKKLQKEATLNPGIDEEPATTVLASTSAYEPEDVSELKRQVEELKQMIISQARQQVQPQQPVNFQLPQFNNSGQVVGTRVKFSSDSNLYPNPIERLRKEQRLQRFAFNENYDLGYSIEKVRYQTVDGHWQSEPRFKLELSRVVFDEETGEPTNKRYVVCRLLMHEDPEAAMVIAEQNGLKVEEESEQDFLNEMRYLRFRDWLLEAFYPPKASSQTGNFQEEVIGGKLVQVFTKASEEGGGVPFGQFNTERKL